MPSRVDAKKRAKLGQIISYTLNDLKALRLDIVRQTKELGNAVASSTTLDQATRDQWHSMRERVIDWLKDEPSWFRSDSQYRRGDAIQKDLLPWYDRLRAVSPSLPQRPTQPTTPLVSPAGFAGFQFGDMSGLVLLALAAFAFSQMRKNGNGRR